MRRHVVGAALAATLLTAASIGGGPAEAQDGSVPSGTWTGWISFGWTVKFDQAVGGGFVFYNGGGPMLFESLGGEVTGDIQARADGMIIPGRGSPFGPQSATIQVSARLRGGAGSIQMRNLTGSIVVGGVSNAFGPTNGGTLTTERVGCTLVGGTIVYPPEGIAAVDAVGTFRPLTNGWTAAMEDEVLLEEERRIVERVAVQVQEIAESVRNDGAPVDRRALNRLIAEAERRVAGLSAEASCGTDWATPLVGALLNLLDAVIVRPETMTTSDLEFLITSAVRAGALPTDTGVIEGELATLLETRLEEAASSGDRAAVDAVFMAALALGRGDLAARAAAER